MHVVDGKKSADIHSGFSTPGPKLVSQKVLTKALCTIQFLHKSIDSSFIITNIRIS